MPRKEIKVKIIRPLEISEKEGFKRDKLGRKGFGEKLAQILEKQPGGNVFALDAGWGQGKTTFIKMWRGHVGKQDRLKTIYFDAFACDYQQDPFLALAAEVYERVRGESLKKAILSVEKLRAINSMAGGALLEKAVGKAGGDIVKKLLEAHDAILTRRLEEVQKAKSAIQIFRESLEQHVKKISPDKPLIFIVDELDRCRPDFALDLLETIKHFFEVSGIIFLLVMNHKALNEMIRTRYGIDDGTRYMQKFIQCWINLPEPNVKKYAAFLHKRSSRDYNHTCELIEQGSPNLREIQQIYTYGELIESSYGKGGSNFIVECIISIMSYMKVVNPSYVQKILNMSERDIIALDWESILGFQPIRPFAIPENRPKVVECIKKLYNMDEKIVRKRYSIILKKLTAEVMKNCAGILVILENPNPTIGKPPLNSPPQIIQCFTNFAD